MTDFSGYDIKHENYKDIQESHTEYMAACAGFEIPEIIDPREWYRIENQSSMSSCVGNALTGPMELSYRQKMGQIAQFSRMDAYLQSQKYSEIVQPGYRCFGVDGGALIAGARRAALERGVCFESTFPYPRGYTTKTPEAAAAEAALYKIMSSSWIDGKSGGDAFDQAKTYLGAGVGGILLGTPWPFNIGSGSTVTSFRNYGGSGHAWCILGYLKDKLVAANSHSAQFEDKGFFYFTRQGFNEMISNRNTTAVGLSDLTTPRGRKVNWAKESMFS